jgi:hypothetical protein
MLLSISSSILVFVLLAHREKYFRKNRYIVQPMTTESEKMIIAAMISLSN